eukprot:GFUD01042124.1.p1 GENE.GFUD01042124.1~~GFUD01042124.1.p1  ORF type:complete len:142 (-),score=26.36 GFUD01042124.1:69-494(-)
MNYILILLFFTHQSKSSIVDSKDLEEDSQPTVNNQEAGQFLLQSYKDAKLDPPESVPLQSSDQTHYQSLDAAQPRSVATAGFAFGWVAVVGLLIFAAANTLIIGSTLAVTYAVYNSLVFLVNLAVPWVAAWATGLIWGVVG